MTRSQKITISVLVVLAIVFVMAFALTMSPDDTAYADPEPLAALTNVSLSGTTLSWDAFAGADQYHVAVLGHGGNGSRSVTETSCDLASFILDYYHCEDGEFDWYVYAEADDEQISKNATSDSSKDGVTNYVYYADSTINYTNTQTPLDSPENLVWDHTIARWDPVAHASGYGIDAYVYDSVNEEWDLMNAIGNNSIYTYYDFGHYFEVDKKYRFSVIAYAEYGDTTYKHSAKVMSPEEGKTFPHVVDTLTNVVVENTSSKGTITFDNITGEDHYELSIVTAGTGFAYTKPIDVYALCEGVYATGDYDIEVMVYNQYKEPLAPVYVCHNFHWDMSYGRQPITGKPTISGTPQQDSTLTVSLAGVTYSGTPKYTWYVENAHGEWNTTGAAYLTQNTYTVSGFIGLRLKVYVETDENIGTVESDPTSVVLPSNADLTGTPGIDGTPKYNSTLSANLVNTNNPSDAYLNYQWRRNGVNIAGATGRDYTLVADDIGKTISVVITSDCYQGSKTSSETATVDKGNKSAPIGLGYTRCTTYLNNDGTITNVDNTMEYKLSTASGWTDVTGTTITGLSSGTYNVRYKESSLIYASEISSVTVESAPTYIISISNGVAKIGNEVVNNASVGAPITIIANEPEEGSIFDHWEISNGAITLVSATSSTTTFEMIADYVSLMAHYSGAPLSGTVSINATNGFKYGNQLTLSLNTNNTGNYSYQWKRGGADIDSATSSTYILVEADIGKQISVVVGSDYQTGTIVSSPTIAIAKADGGHYPYGLSTNSCTTYLNNDGSIENVDNTMEYKLSTASDWTSVTGTTIEDLVPGTYYVRYKETSTHLASAYDEQTIEPARTYDLHIYDGVAKFDDVEITIASCGATITIIADDKLGYDFVNWTLDYVGPVLDDANSSTTTFEMIEDNVYIRANYTPAALTGTVNISGTLKYSETLTASLTNSNATGQLYYQWKRGLVDIDGATYNTYILQEEDIGSTISVVITCFVQTGELSTSTSDVIGKADGNSIADDQISVQDCSDENNNDGVIYGIQSYHEYRVLPDGDWNDGGDTLTDLEPATYQVRYKATSTHNAGPARSYVVNAYDAPPQYGITVVKGTASTNSSAAGQNITITANAPDTNYEFDCWTSSDGVIFENANNASTTFEMLAKDVTVTATYKLVKRTITFNANGGTGSMDPVEVDHGTLYTLPSSSFVAPANKGFSGWAYTNDGDVIIGEQIVINADVVLYAIWNAHVHDMEAHLAQVATCTEDGNIAYWYCDGCGKYFTDELGENQVYEQDVIIDALGHDLHETVIAPTCTEAGYTTHACSRCTYHYEDTEVAALGHNEVIDQAVPATCTETGLTQGKHCSRCSAVLVEQTEVPATGHEWGEWTVTTAPQIGIEGVETRVCAHDANHKETRAVAALPYEYKEEGGVKVYEASVTANVAKDVKSLFEQAKAGNGKVEVAVGTMKITFNESAVNAIGGKSVSLTANVLTNNLDIAGAQLVVEVTLAGSTFESGKATISVPLTSAIPEGKVAKVYYINGNEKVDMGATFKDGKATFETNHFSKFAVVYEDKATENKVEPKKLSGGAIAGIVIACVVFAAGVGVGVFFLLKKKGIIGKK